MFSNTINQFIQLISPGKTRIENLSPVILVFGGPVSVKDTYVSCRNVFLNWAHQNNYELASFLKTPESYPEWNQFEGYSNLVDFERDAGCLSRVVVLFSECPGALAELGAFCMDDVICERLLVIVEKAYYDNDSFIKLGPIKRIEDEHPDHSICVVNSTRSPTQFEGEVEGVGEALISKARTKHKTEQFNPENIRDQLLLIADLVELFGALTKAELSELLTFMGVYVDTKRLQKLIKQLILFELIIESQHLTHRFYVRPVEGSSYLNYSATGTSKFERSVFKLRDALPALKTDTPRFKAYSQIHGEPKWV